MEVARDAKNKLKAIERGHADKKLKETLAQLAEVEKARRNSESTFKGYEKQTADTLEAQRKAENKIVVRWWSLSIQRRSWMTKLLRWPRPSRQPMI